MSRALFYYFGGGGLAPGTGAVVTTPAGASVVTQRGALASILDQYLDPVTLDYVDTDDGEWLETPDSRTLVMIMLEMKLGASYLSPGDGTRIHEALEDPTGAPVTSSFVVAEITRAMGVLASAGILTDFSIRTTDDDGKSLLVDETGRFSPELRWLDLATGSPVDMIFAPF